MALCLSHRRSGPTVALALLGICVEVMCSSDKAALPDGPATEQPGDEWAVKSSCQHRQPPTVSRGAPYVIMFPLMQNLCHLTAVFYFTPFFRNILISNREADLVGTHRHGFCRTGLFWKS